MQRKNKIEFIVQKDKENLREKTDLQNILNKRTKE